MKGSSFYEQAKKYSRLGFFSGYKADSKIPFKTSKANSTKLGQRSKISKFGGSKGDTYSDI